MGKMTEVARQNVGSLDLSDLAQIFNIKGYGDVPYPFMQTGRPGLNDGQATGQYSITERYNDGDLRIFRPWVNAYSGADIRVECRVLHRPDDIPDTRILAFRADQVGFCASQRPDEDVVDVDRLSPYDMGAAITNLLALTGPGRHSRISIPKYVGYFSKSTADLDNDDYEVSVLDVRPQDVAAATNVPNADVAAMGTVQSHCRPARSWGVDWDKNLVAWVQISHDGDYVYERDFSNAVPMTEQLLVKRIDELIAEDVAVLRRRRGITT